MGLCESTGIREVSEFTSDEIVTIQKKSSAEKILAHYTPATFPMFPKINMKTHKLISDSWKYISEGTRTDEFGSTIGGLTAFYTEFYERLDKVDDQGRFEAALTVHSHGSDVVAAKGSILIRIINFVLSLDDDGDETLMKLYMLGKSHSFKGIRPWQYSVFIETLLMTISSQLGTHGTTDVMCAWVNTFAFVLKHMLPPAIEGHIVENEMYSNTSSEFSSAAMLEQLHEEEARKRLKKGLGSEHSYGSKGSSSSPSRNGSMKPYSQKTRNNNKLGSMSSQKNGGIEVRNAF